MKRPIIVITHERSGTHLLINVINFDKKGEFFTIGYMDKNIQFTLENYLYYTKKDIFINTYRPDAVYKSHHQVQFMEEYLDFLFNKYKVIYLKREPKDVLVSYYRFLKDKGEKNGETIENFPDFKDWIYMKPNNVGWKYFANFPDPHIVIEPETYPQRWKLHTDGWLKYKDNMLVLNYEDILTNFSQTKQVIENYISKKIADSIPNINDKTLPNFVPGKGIIGGYKEYMDDKITNWINSQIF
jgi:hypothetical protein